MINPAFMHHIPDNKKEECYNSMLNDLYYFYNSIKPTPEQHIILLDGNYFNLSKDNLLLLNKAGSAPHAHSQQPTAIH